MAPWGSIRALGGGLLMLASWLPSAAAQGTAADYFVRSLPGAPEDTNIKMHAGHITVDPDHNGNLFFWHVANQHIAKRQRTVIWLNGGPGCSSEDGAMMEIGPYRLQDDNTLVPNNGSWHEFANLLFVDNPVGTGFSYVDTDSYVSELDQMADQFITFLTHFFNTFPEYEDDDIYIAGESYAGQHIPYIARHILDHNKSQSRPWNLKGLLIGNGWIAPEEQYEAYLTYAYEKNLVKKGSETANQLEGLYDNCKKKLADAKSIPVDMGACEYVLQEMLRLTQTVDGDQSSCINMYDVRLTDKYPSCGMNWPSDLDFVTPYLRRPEVVAALNVNENKNTGWAECVSAVGRAFTAKNSKPSIELLPELLEEVEILLFSGAEDLICNHVGTEKLIENMTWNGKQGFGKTKQRGWTFDGKDAGFWQQDRNLTYVLFNDASHMVPFDFPERSRDMLDRFIGVDMHSVESEAFSSLLDGEDPSAIPEVTTPPAHESGSQEETADDDSSHDEELESVKWDAYRKSGEVVLAIVAIAAAIWGIYIWRSRRRSAAYRVVPSGPQLGGNGTDLENFRTKRGNRGDIEAGDFDESELDDLHVSTPPDVERERYSIGDDSDEDMNEKPKKGQAGRA